MTACVELKDFKQLLKALSLLLTVKYIFLLFLSPSHSLFSPPLTLSFPLIFLVNINFC